MLNKSVLSRYVPTVFIIGTYSLYDDWWSDNRMLIYPIQLIANTECTLYLSKKFRVTGIDEIIKHLKYIVIVYSKTVENLKTTDTKKHFVVLIKERVSVSEIGRIVKAVRINGMVQFLVSIHFIYVCVCFNFLQLTILENMASRENQSVKKDCKKCCKIFFRIDPRP